MLDYIIVGFGLGGLSFVEQLRAHNKSFVVFNSEKNVASLAASGMYNPVILKRFTSVWQAQEQLAYAMPFYKDVERYLNKSFVKPLPVFRVFNSIEEQNNWLIASDNPKLSPYLSTEFIDNINPYISANNSLGEVKHTGRLFVKTLLFAYIEALKKKQCYTHEAFDYKELYVNKNFVEYKGVQAKYIVFAEGFGLKNNPMFSYLPLVGSKGEVIIIKAPNLNLKAIVKSGVFIMPIDEEDCYLIGASYNWKDKTWNTTNEAKNELLEKLSKFVNCDFEIINQYAGIRPTVGDRRPLVGKHPSLDNVYVLNGLGTRGVMIGPYVSKQLFDYIESGKELSKEINISRFSSKRASK